MFGSMCFRFLVVLYEISTYLQCVSASLINPIAIAGRQFYDTDTGEMFMMKGVDYQPGGSSAHGKGSDPLSDIDQCARDVYLFQQLGINTIRVYSVDTHLRHDSCMTMLAAAGIYVLLDINSPLVGESLDRYRPWASYNPEYLSRAFSVVEEFSHYNNTLGFIIGNEVINDSNSAMVSPPYIRAVSRDVKQYILNHSPRDIPIGYSAADDLRYRKDLPHYLSCGDEESAVDFYAINSYQWCGNQTYHSSGYDILVDDYHSLSIPIVLSEFGCNLVLPRVFQETTTLYSPVMMKYFSGGLVYEFSEETNGFGLVDIDPQGTATLLPDYDMLKIQFEEAQPEIQRYVSQMKRARLSPENSVRTVRPSCQRAYYHLGGVVNLIPESFGTDMIQHGVKVAHGAYDQEILKSMPVTKYKIIDTSGNEIQDPKIVVVSNMTSSIAGPSYRSRKAAWSRNSGERTTEANSSTRAKIGPGFWLSTIIALLL